MKILGAPAALTAVLVAFCGTASPAGAGDEPDVRSKRFQTNLLVYKRLAEQERRQALLNARRWRRLKESERDRHAEVMARLGALSPTELAQYRQMAARFKRLGRVEREKLASRARRFAALPEGSRRRVVVLALFLEADPYLRQVFLGLEGPPRQAFLRRLFNLYRMLPAEQRGVVLELGPEARRRLVRNFLAGKEVNRAHGRIRSQLIGWAALQVPRLLRRWIRVRGMSKREKKELLERFRKLNPAQRRAFLEDIRRRMR